MEVVDAHDGGGMNILESEGCFFGLSCQSRKINLNAR